VNLFSSTVTISFQKEFCYMRLGPCVNIYIQNVNNTEFPNLSAQFFIFSSTHLGLTKVIFRRYSVLIVDFQLFSTLNIS
jgi:hypothetical protein